MKESYKTQLKTGYCLVFTSSCFCEAKQKQKRLQGRYLKPYPIEDYLLKQQISKKL